MQVGQSDGQQKGIDLGAIITFGAMFLALLALPHPLGIWLEEFNKGTSSFELAVCISVALGTMFLVVFRAYRKGQIQLPSRKRQRNVKLALERIKKSQLNGESHDVLKK
jgi:hypothetical protein